MKKLFQKAVSVLGSAAMVGASVSLAAAATFPAPFDAGEYAVVYGAGSQDSSAASVVASGLPSLGGSTTVVLGSDSYLLEKTSTKFHVGDRITAVVNSNVDDDDMPILLADGTYVDDDNDEFDFEQSISLPNHQLVMFEDSDYKADEPTLGFQINNGANVLNYTITMNDEPLLTDLATSDVTIMGKDFYVLSVGTSSGSTSFTLLDSAVDTILSEGETTTLSVNGIDYQVTIEFISSTEVKLSVNGETTNALSEAETYKLNSGAYVGVKDILYTSKDTGISKVEFSIGNGKLVLTSGSDVELNEDTINDLGVTIVNTTTTLTSITLQWNADDDMFVTEDSEVVMPGFGVVKLSMTGIEFPTEEMIEIKASSDDRIGFNDFPLKDSTEDIDLLYSSSGTFAGIGKDSDDLLVTDRDGNVSFDADTDEWFVASWTDGNDGESYLMRVTDFKTENSVNKATFQYRKDGSWTDEKTDAKKGDSITIGNVDITVGEIDKDNKQIYFWNTTTETDFDVLFTNEGLKFWLPVNSLTDTATGAINLSANPLSWDAVFREEDKDGDVAMGNFITVNLSHNSQSPAEPSVVGIVGGNASEEEQGDTDIFENWVYSALATQILHDKGPDQRSVKLVYHGDEAEAKVYLSSTDLTSTTGGESGQKTFMDSETGYDGKNIVVVGGSCVNSVAATLLGGAHCGDAFTGATAVGPGEFLIQTFDYNGKVATVVAGYDKEDTDKGAAYLNNAANEVMTDVGVKYKGQTATESAVKVA